ncbi:PREDICTED: uncharacterized protein LOC109238096 [Nicotiana attenuata]|uniref:uncharacterized protein LOC109238096 n=1 Tax=Nicotiana attenuata TaxID=49451 RepID=UPI00090563EE|nr:PREDICTED: uncharacterized protein LOC109238096 [Nicotiana attenuata]
MVTIMSIVALAASQQWMIYHMDVHNALLNENLLKEVHMHIPLGFARHGRLRRPEGDRVVKNPNDYQRLVGRLLYLTMTRPDIAFAVLVLNEYMHYPKESHMEAALRVVRYIKETPGLGLLMLVESTDKLFAYYDSNWGAYVETRRSIQVWKCTSILKIKETDDCI